MEDIFGKSIEKKTNVIAFHDERYDKKAHWLYHGFLIIEHSEWQPFCYLLTRYRKESLCQKPVHFAELDGSSKVSSCTKLGHTWTKALDVEMITHIRFFLLGVDISKIDLSLFGKGDGSKSDVEMRIYNRFFEIGLFTSLRWFFNDMDSVNLFNILAEERCLSDYDSFLYRTPYRINQRDTNISVTCPQVTMIPGKGHEVEYNQVLFDCLQLTDVLIGGFAQVLDNPNRKAGCIEIGKALLPRIRKMNENPFNINSHAWKRLAMKFFPDKSIAEQIYESEKPYGMMYESRYLKFADRDQSSLFD